MDKIFYNIHFLHPPYSPDLALSDFHPFCSLSNALRGVSLNNWEIGWANVLSQNKEILSPRHKTNLLNSGRKSQTTTESTLLNNLLHAFV